MGPHEGCKAEAGQAANAPNRDRLPGARAADGHVTFEGSHSMANRNTIPALVAAAGVGLMYVLAPTALVAGSKASCGCSPPPPPPPPPPKNCGCKTPPQHHHNGNTTINVVTKVNVNASSNSTSNATANAYNDLQNSISNSQTVSQNATLNQNQTGISNGGFNFNGNQSTGGGGGGGFASPGPVSEGAITVGGEESESYEAERTKFEKVVIQAFCFDDKDVPHPASQVSPDREIAEGYEGEVYRCIAGAHMQVTIAQWRENVSFEGGQTLACQKGEALYHAAGQGGGRLECRPQIPARDCNERSLLRRFGAGIKILTIQINEKYTAYREHSSQAASTSMTFDGGVGGVMN